MRKSLFSTIKPARSPNQANAAHLLAILPTAAEHPVVSEFARENKWNLTIAFTTDQAFECIAAIQPAVVLLDMDLPQADWRPVVARLAHHSPKPCIILASAVADPYLFTELTIQGGYDVIVKPLRLEELRRMVQLAFTFWKNS